MAQFVIAAVPQKSTPKGILEEILDGYDVKDINSRDTEGQLKRRAVTLIENCQTEVLCIEEVQHLVDRRTLQVLGHAGDLFKVLHDNSTALVILSGLPQIRRLIRENPQLATRVRAYITLPRFSWKNERQRAQFISCLAAFESAIKQRFPNFPAISDGEWCYRMFCVCNGIMRLLANFLVEVLLAAGESNKFGLEQFADAYESFVLDATSEGSKIRPFDPDFLTLPTGNSLSLVDSIGRESDGRLEVAERENAGREDEKPPRAPHRARKARAANKT